VERERGGDRRVDDHLVRGWIASCAASQGHSATATNARNDEPAKPVARKIDVKTKW